MKYNSRTALSNSNVLLVPYQPSHVPKYHDWMLSPELRSLTASEPLSLDEEYAMQRSWREDGDKLTFIICEPLPLADRSTDSIKAGFFDGPSQMIGDVNLFISASEEDGAEGHVVGELEIMIASPAHQRKGYGRAALMAFVSYILAHWRELAAEYAAHSHSPRLAYLRVRVDHMNAASISLFSVLGFKKIKDEPNYFGEVEMRWSPGSKAMEEWQGFEETRQYAYQDENAVAES